MTLWIRYKLFLPAIAWLVVIAVLSGFPGKQGPKISAWQLDKFVHTFMYLILSLSLCFPFIKQFIDKNNRLILMLKIVFFGIMYGGFMEILQENIFINRSGNWYDFFANALGTIVGVFILPIILNYLPINRLKRIL